MQNQFELAVDQVVIQDMERKSRFSAICPIIQLSGSGAI